MKQAVWGWAGAIVLSALSSSAVAAGKTCEELKADIEAGLKAKGVTVFALQVVDNQAAEGLKVVGSCGGGTKKIIYMRP
ncbi:MAG: DUF1161 domain-containing protein [Pseudomonadota bacterium]